MKKYIIRQIDYGFDDSHLFQMGKGYFNLNTQFDTLEEAEVAYWKLEHNALAGKCIADYEWIVDYTKGNYQVQDLADYLKKEFGINLLVSHPHPNDKHLLVVDRALSLPHNISLKQTKKLIQFSKLQHYQLIEIKENEPHFFGIEWTANHGYSKKNHWHQNNVLPGGEGGYSSIPVPAVFLSEREALDFITEKFNYLLKNYFIKNGINGTLEELSDSPVLFKSLIESTEGADYDETERKICFSFMLKPTFFVPFNELLKSPIFFVKPLPKYLVEKCQYKYVEM